ncbi:SAM-dependent methyltransferase [Lewinellaceae bacterium SD302]|nr:SAM-dependent methyltransferase [Lewinellaceae bacterium SD302]
MQFTHPDIVVTKDGSHTLVNTDNQQLYHSHGGAIQESKHVFIKHNLQNWLDNPPEGSINVLELGFGSGLNAYLTRLEAEKHNVDVNYHSVELYPVHPDVAARLNYPVELNDSDTNRFLEIHTCKWNCQERLSDNFSINKVYGDFLEQDFPTDHYHSFYYHAFAVKAQPELWSNQVIDRMYHALRPGGILTTFSATGQLGRSLRARGYRHEKPSGVGGKREITRAIK